MEAKLVKDLMEAYASVYAQPEEVITESDCECEDEEKTEKETPEMNGKKKEKKEKEDEMKEDVETDLFDIILEHLVAEGYADTNKAALAIMANMSEEWKQSIVEQNAIVTTGTSTNAAGEKIPWTHRVEPSGKRTVEDRFGKRELREPKLKEV